jgi:AmiR/NasT family two-component response regulator
MMRQPNPLSSYDLVCLALGVLMERDGADSDGALDALLELAIRRGERLEVTAGLVLARAEIAGAS